MTLLRKTLALGAAFAVAVSLFGALSTTAHAQAVPFIAYGTGATAGDSIGVHMADLTLCETVTVDADGNWGPVQVGADLNDCSFSDGDTIAFSVNGDVADQSETWSPGGAPADAATGTVLTVTGGSTPPTPGPTGNAGFAMDAGTSSIAALILAAMATMMVAGGRAATRTR